jgi:ribosomal protein L23
MVVTVVSFAANIAVAHPFHVSLAEAEYKPSTGTIEFALRVNPLDLERALSRQANRRIDLDSTADLGKRVEAYLRRTFGVTTNDGIPCAMKWIGKDISLKAAWLYFEVSIDRAKTIEIANHLFFELELDQVNTINIRNGDQRFSVIFTTSRATRIVDFSSY